MTIFALGLWEVLGLLGAFGGIESSLLHAQEKIAGRAVPYPIIVEIEPNLDKEISEIAFKGVSEAYAGHYKAALETFETLKILAPQHPVGYVYTSVLYYLIVTDFRNYAYEEALMKNLAETIKIGKKWTRKNKETVPWGRFYTAVAYGVRGLHLASYKEYIKAFRDGIRGYRQMNLTLEQVPNFYDALYGIGLYEYWYSRVLGSFLTKYQRDRNKQEGINKLKLAFTKGTLAKTFAGLGLLEIYKLENRKTEGLALVQTLETDFPDFTNLFETIGIFYNNRSGEKNIPLFLNFRTKIETSPYVTPLSYLRIDYELAQNYLKNGQTEKAKEILTNLVTHPGLIKQLANENIPNFLKKKFEESEDLLEKLSSQN